MKGRYLNHFEKMKIYIKRNPLKNLKRCKWIIDYYWNQINEEIRQFSGLAYIAKIIYYYKQSTTFFEGSQKVRTLKDHINTFQLTTPRSEHNIRPAELLILKRIDWKLIDLKNTDSPCKNLLPSFLSWSNFYIKNTKYNQNKPNKTR